MDNDAENIVEALPAGYKLQGNNRTYRIEKKLGQGGFGITYHATGPVRVGTILMEVDFALKEFFLSNDCERLANSSISYSNPARTRVENSRKDFIAEAQRLKKIGFSHPNIVGFDEVFEANNTAYYVMEYIKGDSLDGYVEKKGKLTEKETRELLWPILDAVKLLHQNRICHLDIKPANIMLSRNAEGEMRPVLIDFGLSKHYDSAGHATSTINSFGYSEGYAPVEQYKGITTFSPEADVYSLGATLWHCLTGQQPPSALDLRDGELAAMLPADVSREMRVMIDFMTRDKRTRPQSIEMVEEATRKTLQADKAQDTKKNDESAKTDGNKTVSFSPQTPPPIKKKGNIAEKSGAEAEVVEIVDGADDGVQPPLTPGKDKIAEAQKPSRKTEIIGSKAPVAGKPKSKKTLYVAIVAFLVVAVAVAVVLMVIGQNEPEKIEYTEEPETEVSGDDNTDVEYVEAPAEATGESNTVSAEEEQTAKSAQTPQSTTAKPQSAKRKANAGKEANNPKERAPKAQPAPQKPAPQEKKTDKAHNSTTPYKMDF